MRIKYLLIKNRKSHHFLVDFSSFKKYFKQIIHPNANMNIIQAMNTSRIYNSKKSEANFQQISKYSGDLNGKSPVFKWWNVDLFRNGLVIKWHPRWMNFGLVFQWWGENMWCILTSEQVLCTLSAGPVFSRPQKPLSNISVRLVTNEWQHVYIDYWQQVHGRDKQVCNPLTSCLLED